MPLTPLSLAFAFVLSAQAEPPTATLFQNVRVFDGVSDQLTPSSNVLVQGGRIARISRAAIDAPGVTVIDGAGRTLMPGLIDNHVHIWISTASQEELLAPDFTTEKGDDLARKEAGDMLMRGFTAVRDLGGPIFRVKRQIDAGETPGPRIYPSGAMVSQTSGHGDSRLPNEVSRRFFGAVSKGETMGVNFIADGRDEVLTAVRENLRSGASQIKMMAGGGAATAYDPLDVTQYTLDELRAGVEAAEDWGTYVTVHAYTDRAVRRSIEAGVLCIEHGQLLSDDTMRILARRKIWLSLQCLDEAPKTAPQNVQEKKKLVVDGTDAAFKAAKKFGVKVAWGTDFLFNPKQNANQNRDMMKLKQWYSNAEILRIVTKQNADLLQLSGPRNPYPGRLGVVAEGALADLLLVEGDPIADLSVLADPSKNIRVIMKGGRVFKNTL